MASLLWYFQLHLDQQQQNTQHAATAAQLGQQRHSEKSIGRSQN